MRTRLLAGSLFIVLAASASWAQAPLGTAFTYQGRLETAGGPVNGPHDLRLRLYDALSGGAQVGLTECFNNVSVTDGLFTVAIDFRAQFAGEQRFLEIDVRADTGLDCVNAAGFTILTARQEITPAPHALFAKHASIASNALTATTLILPYSGSVSTGTDSFSITQTGHGGCAQFDVVLPSNPSDAVQAVTAGEGRPGYFENSNTGNGEPAIYATTSGYGGGVFGSGSEYGVYGSAYDHGVYGSGVVHGVFGEATAATGTTYGGRFECASPLGTAVYGSSTADTGATVGVAGRIESETGIGVLGNAATNFGDAVGVKGLSYSQTGTGVYGHSNAGIGTNEGVYGLTESTGGRGVVGYANAASGNTIGGLFQSNSPTGIGVYGIATANTDDTIGVFGVVDSPSGDGVHGLASAGSGACYGVYGESNSISGRGVVGYNSRVTGTIYGVYGQASTAAGGYAVFATGDMGASGLKPFRIDHPDDPANKYLLHYAAESPEVINFYRGTVVLNGAGEAVVELPAYFAKVNKTPSYQLTAVGAPMPMLHVAREIDESALSAGAKAEPRETAPVCSFRIGGGAPGAKVSWEVKALRNDLRVRTHGAPVEIAKQDQEKGSYQHPELYGQPPEKGMNYKAARGEREAQPVAPDATPR